jgi:hypothetical protein
VITKITLLLTSTFFAICLFSAPPIQSESPYLSQNPIVNPSRPPNNVGPLGSFEVNPSARLRGEVERTVPFEVVPGEILTFNLILWNPEEYQNSGEYELILDFPNDYNVTIDEGNITLQGGETAVLKYDQQVPENLTIYGRYVLRLLIDGRFEDFFQFDLHGRDQIEIRWDDGVMDNAYAFNYLCNAWAIRGCLPEGATLDSVGFYILSEGDPGWPWPDDIHQDILVQVFDNDGPGGLPGTLLYNEITRVTPGTSHAVAFPGISISSAFFIANDQLTDYPTCEGQGVDDGVDYPSQMFTRIDNVWTNAGMTYSGDFMIWGVGSVGPQSITFGNPPVD